MRKTWSSSTTVLQGRVERARRLQVGAERLLDDEAGPLGQALAAEHGDHRLHGRRRHRQVDQPAYVVAEPLLRGPHLLGELGAVVGVGGLEADPLEEVGDHLVVEVLDGVRPGPSRTWSRNSSSVPGECRPEPMTA